MKGMSAKPILIAAFILGTFAVGGVSLVAVTNDLTHERIAANQREAMLRKLRDILPVDASTGKPLMDNDPLMDRILVNDPDMLGAIETQVYRVRHLEQPIALVLNPIVPDGYAGPIRLLVSVKKDGSIGGVRVLDHHETPGLGDKIDERKDDWIKHQFDNKSLGNPPAAQWLVKRDGGNFDQFTGATITPRSIVKAVRKTLEFVQQHGDQLYSEKALEAEPEGES